MTTISMFSSSRDLREGLHRCLSLIQAATGSGAEADAPWWIGVPEALRAAAQHGDLKIESLAPLFTTPERHARLLTAFARVRAAPPPPAETLAEMFADAVLSNRALAAHAGRDVYGASNKRLWDVLVSPVAQALDATYGAGLMGETSGDVRESAPVPEVLDLLSRLMTFDTRPEGADHDACAQWLAELLAARGFKVELRQAEGHAPIITATRGARGLDGEIVLYGHYDVSPVEPGRAWRYPPNRLTAAEGRLWGRGVADNLGPLATRLWALETLTEAPALRWIIQGEEERGSPLAHRVFPELLAGLRPTLWLEETGYHDHADGTLRLLSRTIGAAPDASEAPDDALERLLLGLRLLMRSRGLGTRAEARGLNKDVVEGGCPFNRNLPPGARYIALGINDSRARIHAHDESIPAWTGTLHRDELALLFRWAHRVAGEHDP
ncbi:M20/M25/M40 family metallo-hydrolase [Nannocystis pusilla]|uniref:M20/M25/M40 family metallo-hydrolase n=1 Tax=Nannocystis pusilla TaxID=889268 RepID=UPI003BF153D3